MASIVLGTVGATVGAIVGGPVGASIGYTIGSTVGGVVDNNLFATKTRVSGARLANLSVQTSTYGKMIPITYGTVRLAGNIIWALPIKETENTAASQSGGKGGGAKVTQSQTTYSYSVSLAVGLCQGPIDGVLRVWADSKILDPSQGVCRLYKGTEDQLPDSLIEAHEGVGNTPAYRGLAYIVLEDFPLAEYGNRIPNFTFEVTRKALAKEGETPVEEMIKSMIIIPGSGEFVYDTVVQNKLAGEEIEGSWVQQGASMPINQHNRDNKADSLVALSGLMDTCPNLEWVAPVVGWFGNSTGAGDCLIQPGVEFASGATTSHDIWAVGSYSRDTAYLISSDEEGNPAYGGTVSDSSLLRFLDELKDRGLAIMFYPLFFMDTENKPWRGRLTGSAAEVADFFTRENGYNDFILHYANLVADKVDAFIIGSELIGLTSVQAEDDSFPAVNALVELAAAVKAIVGPDVKVTYAADWSEYHHTTGGWYNMDPLWASPNIDIVGIDAYFSLTDAPQNGYNLQNVMDGWTSGEGYDWIYTDEERTTKASISSAYAWKNIAWWWSHTHTNPDGSVTSWVPESKKIWFTEYGFPSVDGATNQPNVFYDPSSSESFFPRFSRGRVDFRAQRLGLTATETKWQDSPMVERRFVWTWDARPYPFWPDLGSVWRDGRLWKTGHWVNGKLALSNLGAIVEDIAAKTGIATETIDASRLTELVDGYVLTSRDTARSAIEALSAAYFFDSVETEGALKFIPRGQEMAASIAEEELIPDEGASDNSRALLAITRMQEMELPARLDVTYLDKITDYQVGSEYAERLVTESQEAATLSLPVVLSGQLAKTIAEITLYTNWQERLSYRFSLDMHYAHLEPADIVEVLTESATHRIRITRIEQGKNGVLEVAGVAEELSVYDRYVDITSQENAEGSGIKTIAVVAKTESLLLDLPAFPLDSKDSASLRIAACGLAENWQGAALYRSDDGGSSYARLLDISSEAGIGSAAEALPAGPVTRFDYGGNVTVILLSGELESVSELSVLNGANLALMGDELLQFTTATLISPQKYRLSGLLRGRLGTEDAVSSHSAGEHFVLLDGKLAKTAIPQALIGLSRPYKAVSVGSTLGEVASEDFTYKAVALKPYSPVHITGVRDGSGNLTLSWVRRARVSAEWADNIEVPLDEASEAYEVEVLSGGATLRTIRGLSESIASYSAADQVADFGAAQSSIAVRVYQLSALVGRGRAGVAVV